MSIIYKYIETKSGNQGQREGQVIAKNFLLGWWMYCRICVAQFCDYTEKYCTVHFKRVNLTACELHLGLKKQISIVK